MQSSDFGGGLPTATTSRPVGRKARAPWLAVVWLGASAMACGSSDTGDTSHSDTSVSAVGEPDAGTPDAALQVTQIDRSALGDVGSDKPLDYNDPRLWLCRPGNAPDECDANLDATEIAPDGSRKLIKHVKAEQPAFDCFYVYPTVKLTSAGPMTDFSKIDITLDPLLAQGARFSRVCRMYAPLYRQNGVVPGAGGAPTPGGGFDLGLSDVRDAFKYYLEHLSNGRRFVVLGHSQGTGMLTSMLAQDVDPNPEVRKKLISALLIGGGVAVPDGKDVGGTFKNIPLCTKAGQVGCVISYVSYAKEAPPAGNATFGHSSMAGQSAGCTEPALLAGRAGKSFQGSYVSMNRVNKTFTPMGAELIPTDIGTPFVLYRDVLSGACKNDGTYSYLEISLDVQGSATRPQFPYRYPAFEASLGLHLMDYNLELDDLIEAVRLSAVAAGS